MDNAAIVKRVSRFLDEVGTPVTKFCERVKIAGSTFYAWKNGQLTLSQGTLARIDEYLKKYNF